MGAPKHCSQSDFYCTKCGNKGIPIMRPITKKREQGHLKKMYCVHCKEEVNHCEISNKGSYTYEDFKLEYETGRFVNGERVELKNLCNCQNFSCKFCVNNKCWNALKGANCPDKRLPNY